MAGVAAPSRESVQVNLQDLPRLYVDDLLTLVLGKKLGNGISRQAYVCKTAPNMVVKVETGVELFQNVREWLVWESVRHNKSIARWLAPVHYISDCGRWMYQSRTRPMKIDQLRKRVPKAPKFLTDLKTENWGEYKGRVVCHDYGTALTAEYGITSALRKAHWWTGRTT